MRSRDAYATYLSKNPFVSRYFWSRLRGMAEMMEPSDARVILDIGCGRDELLRMLAKKFPRSDCIGIDIARGLGDLREANLSHFQNEQFLRADCMHLPLRPKSARLVFCASLLEHLPTVEPALSEMQRVLESEGTLVVGIPTENRLYSIARRMARLQEPSAHFHKSDYVETVLKQRFSRSRARKLPLSFLPDFLSLYDILLYRQCSPNSKTFRARMLKNKSSDFGVRNSTQDYKTKSDTLLHMDTRAAKDTSHVTLSALRRVWKPTQPTAEQVKLPTRSIDNR